MLSRAKRVDGFRVAGERTFYEKHKEKVLTIGIVSTVITIMSLVMIYVHNSNY